MYVTPHLVVVVHDTGLPLDVLRVVGREQHVKLAVADAFGRRARRRARRRAWRRARRRADDPYGCGFNDVRLERERILPAVEVEMRVHVLAQHLRRGVSEHGVGLHALPGVRLVIPTVISIIPCSKRQYSANKRTEMAQARSDNPHTRIRCYQCGQLGHIAANCPSPPSKTGSTPFRLRRLVSSTICPTRVGTPVRLVTVHGPHWNVVKSGQPYHDEQAVVRDQRGEHEHPHEEARVGVRHRRCGARCSVCAWRGRSTYSRSDNDDSFFSFPSMEGR